MAPWQERVIVERDELADKLAKLSAFVTSRPSSFETLTDREKNLMRAQREAMLTYHEILEERVSLWYTESRS